MRFTVHIISLFALFVILGIPSSAMAKKLMPPPGLKVLKEIISSYQKSGLVQMKVEKRVIFELLGKERIHTGELTLAPKRFRLETTAPERTLILFDGKKIWNVQYPPEGSDAKVQIARAKVDRKNQNQIFLTDLLVGQSIFKQFDFFSEQRVDDKIALSAKPKKLNDQIKDLTITVDQKIRQIVEISYADELGNRTQMKLSDFRLSKKVSPGVFHFKPAHDAEVTDL